jgi:hypothetical protein
LDDHGREESPKPVRGHFIDEVLMANLLYPKYKEYLLTHLTTDTVKGVFVDAALYTYSASHQFLSDIPAGARIGTPQTIGSKTVTGGVFDGADVTFSALSGATGEYVAVFVDSGNEATSRLIILIDTGTGLPITPVGNNHTVAWNASGIFGL